MIDEDQVQDFLVLFGVRPVLILPPHVSNTSSVLFQALPQRQSTASTSMMSSSFAVLFRCASDKMRPKDVLVLTNALEECFLQRHQDTFQKFIFRRYRIIGANLVRRHSV